MKYTIYKITNKINGKQYIGKHQTNNVDDGYMGSGKLLKRAQARHGIENFSKEILHIFDTEEEMNAKEAELVTEQYCARDDTYNICAGGKGGFGYINTNNKRRGFEATIGDPFIKQAVLMSGKRGRETQKQKRLTDPHRWQMLNEQRSIKLKEHRAKNGPAFADKKHSPLSKEKISRAKKGTGLGSCNSQYGSFWITDGSKNRKVKFQTEVPAGWYRGRAVSKRVYRGHDWTVSA